MLPIAVNLRFFGACFMLVQLSSIGRQFSLVQFLTKRFVRRRPSVTKTLKSVWSDVTFGGLWGRQCKLSPAAKENCALRCLSAVCYEHIYGDDPLEEGELDYKRGKEYKYCMYRLSMSETIDGVKGAFDL